MSIGCFISTGRESYACTSLPPRRTEASARQTERNTCEATDPTKKKDNKKKANEKITRKTKAENECKGMSTKAKAGAAISTTDLCPSAILSEFFSFIIILHSLIHTARIKTFVESINRIPEITTAIRSFPSVDVLIECICGRVCVCRIVSLLCIY